MPCEGVNYWTFSELVAAFLDLSIAYCLLCASGFSFLASKLLGLFGLCLPCPCDGHFWNPTNPNPCLQSHLIQCPFEKISSVSSSVRAKSPFEGGEEAECGPTVEFGGVELEECGGKRRRVVRNGLRRRGVRRGETVGCGKAVSVSLMDARSLLLSHSGVGGSGDDIGDENGSKQKQISGGNAAGDDRDDIGGDGEGSVDFGLAEDVSVVLELDDPGDSDKCFEGGFVNEKIRMSTIRELEEALEEERSARSALFVELEKERSAAASAADEAMAMILRLQEEKASIEMEARQYQRMIEAKAAYDAEEMNILKEILLRREREKHFLEKEVEGYRLMVLGNDQYDSDLQDLDDAPACDSTLYLTEDPILTPQQTNDFIEKPKLKILDNTSEYGVSPIKSLNRALAFGKELAIPELAEDDDSLKQEDIYEHTRGNNMSHECVEKSEISQVSHVKSAPFLEDPDHACNSSLFIDLASKKSEIPYQEKKDSSMKVVDDEYCVHDVHVVDDESKMLNQSCIEINEQQVVAGTVNVPRRVSSSSYDARRSCSDIPSRLPPSGISREKGRVTNLRRNSMSAVDYERVKIDNEVEWLTERLRIVQKGREKLNLSAGHKDREKLKLKLLEDIASQLREIRQLNEPAKAEREASLPPSYAKGTSMKRRWRSESLNIHRSS